jgi:hypothetical protein
MEKRLQIDFSERAYDELEDLQKRLDAKSKSEVIRTSLGVLRWLLDESEADNQILLQNPEGGTERVVFHFLDRVRPRAKTASSAVKKQRAGT